MYLEKKFRENLDGWKKHAVDPFVLIDSSLSKLFECDHYKNLVGMGKDILPLLLEELKKDDEILVNGLPRLVKEIVGEELKFPEGIQGRVYEISDYTRTWLENKLS